MKDDIICRIESARNVNRRAARLYRAAGVEPADVAIAAVYSAHDLATDLHEGDPAAAIEWMRTALDLMERQLLDAKARAH